MAAPLHFTHDACLRCGHAFGPGDEVLVVAGGPAARYREVGLAVCGECQADASLDRILMSGLYSRPLHRPVGAPLTWPVLNGAGQVDGYAKVARLSNGAFRVGLHRGHVEVWSAAQVVKLRVADPTEMGYSADYGMYGPVALLGRTAVRQDEVRFVRLSHPGYTRQATS
jgi:hypothetical protein